jgi:hypothetical protein
MALHGMKTRGTGLFETEHIGSEKSRNAEWRLLFRLDGKETAPPSLP